MTELLTADNIFTLGMLTLLQVVLGFDNLLYISLESKRAPQEKQAHVRRLGIGLAVALRIVLLFVLVSVIGLFKDAFASVHLKGWLEFALTGHALIVLLGGIFIIYTAMKEIWHLMGVTDLENEKKTPTSVFKVVFWIVLMNLVFSFDSILSAIALTDVFSVMAIAIVIGGILMIWLADHVAKFLERNRIYEVLGLFILFVVGIMLVSEGGHLAHLRLFGVEITPMSKATFYFVIAILVVSDIVQSTYQKRLLRERSEFA